MNSASVKLQQDIRYCTRCCIPETQEGIQFDELGICTACRASEQKMHINWAQKEQELRRILEKAKESSTSYDCILPISGGKDSFFQAHILTRVYGLRPLAVTFSHNWFSETGLYNLQLCLKTFDLDHIQFTPSRGKVNKIARQSLFEIGDACWHCHSGVGAFPLKVALAFDIKLLIWGESVCESSGRATYNDSTNSYDKEYFLKVSAKKTAEQIAESANIDIKYLSEHKLPTHSEIAKAQITGLHLGDYIFWDEERQTEFIKEHYHWRETEMEGAIKGYKSVECIMAGVHDFMCYQKRAFGRATMQAAVDIRSGLMTREEGLEVAKNIDSQIPQALDYYLSITGITKEEFYASIASHKHEALKDIAVESKTKIKSNCETPIPYYEQLISKHINKNDSRLSDDEERRLESSDWY